MTTLHGTVEPGFAKVADAFATCFSDYGDVGAAVAVVHDGHPVVDLWAGAADATGTRPWARDTVVMTFSTTKGVTAVCANLLIQRGRLDPNAPVARYWPEFAANGKHDITVAMVMSHRAGIAAVDGDISIDDVLGWHGVVNAIAAQAPQWKPGSAHGYHARTYGWITGEIVRRITGVSAGTFFADGASRLALLDRPAGGDRARVRRLDSRGRALVPLVTRSREHVVSGDGGAVRAFRQRIRRVVEQSCAARRGASVVQRHR